ncbi:MAG: hypothetical protein J0L57_15965 [Burkholderiales bacterium]|nr:hypothetical protein [Burkholderiales bacterium]
MNRNLTALTLVGLAVLGLTPGVVHAKKILLWNTLDSPEAIADSEKGPRGKVVGASFAFEAAQFGNGYVRKATGNNWVEFPRSIPEQLRSEGTVELWINPKVPKPVPYQYGAFGLLNGPYSPYDTGFRLYWGDGVSGNGLVADNTIVSTPNESRQFVATPGVPFHVALTWDVGGIDGSADTIRVYRNGKVVNSTTGKWGPDDLRIAPLQLGWSPDGGGYDKFITDQIVVRDYAKTWYGDRFDATPTVPEPSTLGMWFAGGLLLLAAPCTRRALAGRSG